jgi:hypothetical protein
MRAITGYPAIVIDEKTFKTQDTAGEEVTIYIDTVYEQYRSEPSDLDQILRRFAAIMTRHQAEAQSDQLVVIVRPSDYVSASVGTSAKLDVFLAPRALAGDLSLFLAIDSPESIRTAQSSDLVRWGLTESDAWAKAISAIKQKVGPIGFARLEGEPDSSLLVSESGLAPSILAEPASCGPNSPDGFEGAILLLLSRDSVLFGFPKEKRSISTFWRIVRARISNQSAMSSTPITCKDGSWVSVALP